MRGQRVLFVCTHNGARSRIAEEFARLAASGQIEVDSSSFESETIGPLPVFIMREIGIEIEPSPPKSVFERFRDKEGFDYVITLCDPGSEEQVSIFLSSVDTLYKKTTQRINWPISSFRSIGNAGEGKKEKARQIRDRIKKKVLDFLFQLGINSDFV